MTANKSAEASDDLSRLPRLTLSDRQLFDAEQILVGGFAPLTGFLNEADYGSVVENMHLSNGALWPIPVVLDVPDDSGRKVGERVILCDRFGNPIAFYTIESIYTPDRSHEAKKVYGTTDTFHPGVRYLMEETHPMYTGGSLERIAKAPVHDFTELRADPAQLKERFKKSGVPVVAFQTRNPMHRAHYEVVRRAVEKVGGRALIHPVVGITKEGDVDYVSRVRAYKRLHKERMSDFADLALLPLAMRMAGPREAIWHALIRKNYGATHFIVGRDHAGVSDAAGKSYYGIYESQNLAKKFEREIGIEIMPSPEMVYVENENRYVEKEEVKPTHKIKHISGSQFRAMLRAGEPIPEWFAFPEVVEEIKRAMQKESRRGAVVFLTGLSGAGKSTVAHVLYHMLLERQDRSVTLLDGDVVRQELSKGLGFTREDRDLNIARIGFVAAEIAKHGGIAICAAIAAYDKAREKNRRVIGKYGTYIEVYVSTPIEVCEQRDSKGLYQKARAGLITHFSGVDDPYEAPANAEIVADTSKETPEQVAERIYALLKERGIVI
ncbi:MAG TPA: bifunctional sulfate adenylyltransferase/adenylylsulfate kinase [Candidatus Paceibacterota bacterium]|nr:bifunctional sulfate adenylyltransferase/adenylylsulfate kinase [Candidatus Paceibacterota bacterium]